MSKIYRYIYRNRQIDILFSNSIHIFTYILAKYVRIFIGKYSLPNCYTLMLWLYRFAFMRSIYEQVFFIFLFGCLNHIYLYFYILVYYIFMCACSYTAARRSGRRRISLFNSCTMRFICTQYEKRKFYAQRVCVVVAHNNNARTFNIICAYVSPTKMHISLCIHHTYIRWCIQYFPMGVENILK